MKSRNLLWQLPLLLLLSLPVWWGQAAKFLSVKTTASSMVTPPDPSFVMSGVFLSQSSAGKDDLLVTAGHIYSQNNQTIFKIRDVEALMLGDKGRSYNIKGGQAIYDSDKKILTILDDVMVVMDNVKVITSAIRYLVKFEKFKSAADVEVITEGMRVSGNSFLYDLPSGDFRVGKRVRCKIW